MDDVRMDRTADDRDHGDPREAAKSPVLFWNDVSLDLVALDHSLAEQDLRAFGPCATARALGLAHAVMADAVRVAYPPAQYEAFRNVAGPAEPVKEPALFVGGAMAAILRHIYDSVPHLAFIDTRRAAFLRLLGRENLDDWRRGLAFGSDDAYKREWNWPELLALIDPKDTSYQPSPGRHDVDPFNPGQGFYGQRWGEAPPFVLTPDQIAAPGIAPPEPPPKGSERYERDVADVRIRGALHGTAEDPQRTPEQVDVGVFWAYDGARLIGTPPRLYNQIVVEVAKQDRMSQIDLARLLALCNLAMADAGIVAWRTKYAYAVWRPVLGIRNRENANETDRNWKPLGAPRTNRPDFVLGPGLGDVAFAQSLLGGNPRGGGGRALQAPLDPAYAAAAFTPNFPAYPSGHATFGAACFTVLRKVRAESGATQREPDSLRHHRGPFVSDELDGASVDNFRDEPRPLRPQRFETLEQMTDMNNESRVWLGVHWKFDADEGEVSGKAIADVVHGRAFRRT